MLPITHWFKQFLLLRVFWHRTAVATWLTLWLVSTRGNKVAMWGMGKNNPSAHAAGRLSYKISKQLNWTAGRQKLGTSHNIKGERNRGDRERPKQESLPDLRNYPYSVSYTPQSYPEHEANQSLIHSTCREEEVLSSSPRPCVPSSWMRTCWSYTSTRSSWPATNSMVTCWKKRPGTG